MGCGFRDTGALVLKIMRKPYQLFRIREKQPEDSQEGFIHKALQKEK
jgi:hypothetical protein